MSFCCIVCLEAAIFVAHLGSPNSEPKHCSKGNDLIVLPENTTPALGFQTSNKKKTKHAWSKFGRACLRKKNHFGLIGESWRLCGLTKHAHSLTVFQDENCHFTASTPQVPNKAPCICLSSLLHVPKWRPMWNHNAVYSLAVNICKSVASKIVYNKSKSKSKFTTLWSLLTPTYRPVPWFILSHSHQGLCT